VIESLQVRIPIQFTCVLLPLLLGAADRGKVSGGLERLLYVTDRSGISVYDINDSHHLLRKIEVPETGDYKGISASVLLGKVYLTSYKKDELVCLDVATDKVLWRRHYDDGYADSPAITPDGKTLYLPLRDGDSWWVIDAATGDPKAKIPVTHGKEYAADDHPILGVGPHNTWMNRDGTRVYLEVLTDPYVYIADTRTNRVIGKVGRSVRASVPSPSPTMNNTYLPMSIGCSVSRWEPPALAISGAARCCTAWKRRRQRRAWRRSRIRRRGHLTARRVTASTSDPTRKRFGW